MNIRLVILFTSFFFLLESPIFCQEVATSQVKELIERIEAKGLSEELLRERLLAVGIDLEKITEKEFAQLDVSINLIIENLEKERQEIETEVASPENEIEEPEPASTNPLKRGQLFFEEANIPDTKNFKPQDTYILGSGDELNVSIFGPSQFDGRFEINLSGFIQPTGMAKIFLKGVALGQAKALVRSRFARYLTFQKEQCIVSLINPRKIAVQVIGDVKQPGTHTFVGTQTAIDVLQSIGGPTETGSMRYIQLIRGKEKKILDLYKIMEDPTLASQFTLEEGDIIHVPFAKKVVGIQGKVLRPMLYEVKKEEGLMALIELAGGLKADAYKKIIQIKRFGTEREEILDIPLGQLIEKNQEFELNNGDVVTIKGIASEVENYVTVTGSVAFPGSYSLNSTSTIYSLLQKGVLLKEARLDKAILIRINSDGTKKLIQLSLDSIDNNTITIHNLVLQKEDKLVIYEQERFIDKSSIKVTGAVRETIEYPYDPSAAITIAKAIFLAGGLKADAANFGFIIRQNPKNNKEQEYIRVDIEKAIANPESEANITMAPSDELNILSNSTFFDEATVKIMGSVRQPGTFPYHESLTLNDLITLSGGLSFGAALNRVDLFRVEMKNNQSTKTIVQTLELDSTLQSNDSLIFLEPFDEVVVRNIPQFKFQKYIKIEGEIKYPGQYALLNDDERLASVINRAGGLTKEAYPAGSSIIRAQDEEGLLVSNIEEALGDPSSKFNYILKEGDVITIPKNYNLVTISVSNTKALDLYPADFIKNNKINVPFEKEKKAKWYIKEYAAGIGYNISRSNIAVRHLNGKLKRTRSFAFVNFYPKVKPGSIISISDTIRKTKKEKTKKERQRVNWERLLGNMFQSVTLGVTTVLLVKQL